MKRMGFQSHFATDDVYNKKRNCTELMQQALCQIGMLKYRDIIIHENLYIAIVKGKFEKSKKHSLLRTWTHTYAE